MTSIQVNLDSFVVWATILSPIIAVIIAVVTSCLNSKDTKKQVASIAKLSDQQAASTAKQLDAIKRLSILQAEIAIIQNEIEVYRNGLLLTQVTDKIDDSSVLRLFIQHDINELPETLGQNKQLKFDHKYYSQLLNKLNQKQEQLQKLKKELEQIK